LEVHKQNEESPNSINIFHQHIRGLRSERDELIHFFETDNINAHILSLSEHRMVEQELLHLTMNGYLLGSSFCRKDLQQELHVFLLGQINIAVKLIFLICAIQLVTKTSNLIMLSLYRASSGDVHEFLRRSDGTLKYLYNPKSEFIISRDINIKYINENNNKKTNSLLKTCSLSHTL
jgi:hypothetical protein